MSTVTPIGLPAADRPLVETPLHTWVSDHCEVTLPPHHPFPMPKYVTLRERVLAEGIVSDAEMHRSEEAPVEWIRLSHDPEYVDAAISGRLEPAAVRRLGLPWSPELVRRARAALYGTVMAARAAIEHGVAGNLAGGTHHAYPDRGEGYCLFNDIATAIAVLREEGFLRRPFVLDLDVHQGNGTAVHFAGDPSVFTLSVHAEHNYPLQKERSSLDVGLPCACDDEVFHRLLDEHLPRALDEHEPDFVVYQAGVDGLAEDRLGKLGLSHEGLRLRDEKVFRICEERELPIVLVLGGGYGDPIEASIEAHCNLWREARMARDRRR